MVKKNSDIRGDGYGTNHAWKNKGTEQSHIPVNRSTLFVCEDCGVSFRHWYHEISDIYKAMELNFIPKKCKNNE